MSISCPSCESKKIVKNGKIHNGKQNYKCRDCGRQFVEHRQQKIIPQSTRDLIDKLLLEKIPLAGQPAKQASVARRDLGAHALRQSSRCFRTLVTKLRECQI